MSRRGRHYTQSRMIEHPALTGIFFPGDINARLLVEPPERESEILGNLAGFFQHNSVRHEHGVDITSHASSIVGQGHGGATHNEYIGNDTPADKAVPKGGEGSLDLCPAKKNVIRPGHAASRSLADR